MVYSSGSKASRNQASIVNRGNTCGGVKKSGTGPTVGFFLSSRKGQLPRAQVSVPLKCVVSKTIQTQKYGYSAVHGGNMG